MPPLSYQQTGLVLKRPGEGANDAQIRDLQRHLRALGYLRQGIDGAFGPGTEGVVRGLQHDLLHNDGDGSDGQAPVRVRDYNDGRLAGVTGELSPGRGRRLVPTLMGAGGSPFVVARQPHGAWLLRMSAGRSWRTGGEG